MLELLTKAIGKLLKLKPNTDKSTSTSSKSNSGNSSRRKVLSKEIELQDISGGTTKIEYSLLTREYLEKLSSDVLISIILAFVGKFSKLTETIEKLLSRLNSNSSNSDRPPSTDNPHKKDESTEPSAKGKPGAKPGHQGFGQDLIMPSKSIALHPTKCACGCEQFISPEHYYTHQYIELPEIKIEVIHFLLFREKCKECGALNNASIPGEFQTGYGSRLSSMIAELAGNHGDSRETIQNFCTSVLDFHISLGAIQKIIDRASEAILPHYEAIGEYVRQQSVNHVDETTWRLDKALCWLWVLACDNSAFFMVHANRSKVAFLALIKDWQGILVSDDYRIYTNWVGLRQTCLAHLIRKATKLSENSDRKISEFGISAQTLLKQLCHMAHAPPTTEEWTRFYEQFMLLISRNFLKNDEAGKFSMRLFVEMDSLWLFLNEAGVSPTNNHAERLLRFAVCWRKRSYGSMSEKGERWVERILTLRQTSRLRSKRTYQILVDAMDCYFTGKAPDLSWVANGN